jgi:hypothetical protein
MKASAVDPNIQEVRIDNQRGAGAVPLNQEVDYFGLRVLMRPSTFLRLALPLESDQYVKRMEDHIEAGGAIGAPFLSIDIPQAWEQTPPDFAEPAEVKSHDGRHRMMAIRRLEGDRPVEVHLFPIGLRNRHITPEWREALRRSMISQRSHNGVARGPLFQDADVMTEAKDIKACGDCFQAAARNMLNRGDDDMSLVHAYVSGQGKLQGRRFLHAWNEQGDTVIDNSNGRNIRLPREIYYAIGNIDPTDSAQYRRYDRQEAVRHMARSRHYGPWDLKETVNRVQPVVPVTKQYPTKPRPKDPPVPDTAKKPVKPAPKSGVDLIAEQESNAYMSGHCHVMALALKSLHPTWQIRAHIGWDADAENDSDYRVDHVYIVDPSTGAAYDCRGRFATEQELVGHNTTGGVETQFVDYDLADLKSDIQRGELRPFSKQDVVQAAAWYEKNLLENFADGKKPGRKGLAKRVGVDCRQSVSRLRKIAKSSSGERQRMAHWCANMKAGRQKSK